MSGRKHLIVIHGRSTKPSRKEKGRLVKQCLLHGLERVDPAAAAKIAGRDVKYSFVYYGDISNALILEKDKEKKHRLSGSDPDHGNVPCEPDGYYDRGIELLLNRNRFTKRAYSDFLDEYPDRRWMNEAGSVISFLGGLVCLSDNIIKVATADMGAYLMTRLFSSAIRERLQTPLKRALKAGDDVCLVSHSMGCIVAYDVLWKFSRMSEYRDVREAENPVSCWITLGNPLGEPGVVKNLYDSNERADGRYPSRIVRDWINISAVDDFICHDTNVANDYAPMKRAGHVESIRDEKIYSFWLGEKHTNPHKFYGYLDNPGVARRIVEWMAA